MSLPRSAGATLVPLASLLGERVAESREGLDSNVGDLVRLCVHASSLRGIGAIAELSTRTTARILGLSSAQLDLWREDDVRPRLVSFWRRHDVHLEPLDAEILMRLERTTDAHVTSSVVRGAAGRPRRRIDRVPDRAAASRRRRPRRPPHRAARRPCSDQGSPRGGDAVRTAHGRADRRRDGAPARAARCRHRPADRAAQPPRLRRALPRGAAAGSERRHAGVGHRLRLRRAEDDERPPRPREGRRAARADRELPPDAQARQRRRRPHRRRRVRHPAAELRTSIRRSSSPTGSAVRSPPRRSPASGRARRSASRRSRCTGARPPR